MFINEDNDTMKYSSGKPITGTRYNSRWDGSTLLILLLIVVVCIWLVFLDDWLLPVILMAAFLLIVITGLLGIYYRIDGNNLVVYQFFRPTAYPIDKISEIKPTNSILSSPATSLTHRLAVSFSDRKVLKSAMPLVISPVRQREFIDQLLAINPDISH
jgi:hypothetical protein